jgi:hypothetical protein
MTGGIRTRLARCDWAAVGQRLDEAGSASLGVLLGARECRALAKLYAAERRFRSTIDMARHRFGEGQYRYFAAPLPELVAELREAAYVHLAPLANRWMERLGRAERYPARLDAFLAACHARGQTRPTPLLLRYTAGGFNCLHQDLYGAIAFPLQIVVLLSRPGGDFRGGELLLVEQRPRSQSRGEAIALRQGEALVFPNRFRPVAGARGDYRVVVRHGVSPVRAGERTSLGIIFHDAA